MARRKAPKNFNLLRAVYSVGARTLQHYVNAACEALPALDRREVAHPTLGTVRINHHAVDRNGLYIHLVAKFSGEAAATVSDTRGTRDEGEQDALPPAQRAFKTADLYALLRGNHLVICSDGIRHQALEYYLKNFLQMGGQSNASVMFSIERIPNVEAVATLQRGGVKEIKISGTLHNATAERLAEQPPAGALRSLSHAAQNLKDHLAAVFEKDEDEEFSDHADQLQVQVVIKARGGIRAEQIVLARLEDVGVDLVNEADNDIGYEIKTNDNKTIKGSDLVVTYPVQLERSENGNSLVRGEVYDKLIEAMANFSREGDLDL